MAAQALTQGQVATPAEPTGGAATSTAQTAARAGDGELVALRTRDSKTYQLSGGRRKTVFGHHLHYQPRPGQWEDNDLTFRQTAPQIYTVDRNQVIITVSATALTLRDRDSGRGIAWQLPSPPKVNGRTVTYTHDGLVWEYTALPTGVKLSARSSTKRGPHVYSFPYLLVGATTPLTGDPAGRILGDGFHVPASTIRGADHHSYPIGTWLTQTKGEISLRVDDSTVPTSALPYEIDPPTSFADDANSAGLVGSMYWYNSYPPPESSTEVYPWNGGASHVGRDHYINATYGDQYAVYNGFLRWDTSQIGGAAVQSATLRMNACPGANDDGRSLTADWYNTWPLTTAAYSPYAQTNALGGYPLTQLAQTPCDTSTSNIPLDNVAGINGGGWTGLRFHISGGIPSGFNYVDIRTPTEGPLQELLVTYSGAPAITSVSPNSGITAGSSALNTETIHGSGFTGATDVTYGGTRATNFNVDSDTQITAFSPPHVVGTVDIQVTTPYGTSAITTADQFTYFEPARSVVFVHGINANYVDIERKRDWAPLVGKLSSRYATFVYPYYQDMGYASGGGCAPPPTLYPDHGTGPLYVDPNSENRTICDSKGALAYSSSGLADYLANTVARWAPSTKIAVIGHSMGAAITRGWLALAQNGTTTEGGASGLGNVDTAIFISGAQEGSFIAALAGWLRHEENPFAAPFQAWMAHKASEKLGFDFHRPGVVDMTPSEGWYHSVNGQPLATNLHYYNFSMDIHAQNETTVFFHTFGTNDLFSVGDLVMLPGDDDPNHTNVLGGSRFLPSGSPHDTHQFIVNNHHTVLFNGVVPNRFAFVDFPSDPAAHWNLGSHVDDGQVTVDSCNGSGSGPTTVTIAQKVVDLLSNPALGCGNP